MQGVPQPAEDPYDTGDEVVVYVAEEDPDAEFHGLECRVVERFEDTLDRETGRRMDKYSYRLQHPERGVLPVQFRHSDLIPISE